MLGAADAPAPPLPETAAPQEVTATAASVAELVAPPSPVVAGRIHYPLTADPGTACQRGFCTRTRLDLRIPNGASVQDRFDEVGKIAALYHEHNLPFTYDDEWDLLCLRMECRRIRDTIPLTSYIVDGIAARTMTCALFKRWVTAAFHIDPELPMSDPRNLGQGAPPPPTSSSS
jgi:hypothetical protein